MAGRIANLFAGELDQRRGFLWAPVLIGIGIGFYFSLPREPLGIAIHGATLIVGGFAIFRRWRGQTAGILTVCACLLLGMSLAKMRVEQLGASMLARSVTTMVSGRVASTDIRSGRRPRVILDDISVERLPVTATPARIRISFGSQQAMPDIGDTITVRGRIGPVPGPSAPGDYDPRRSAYFDGLGGSGFALGRWRVNDQQAGKWRVGTQAKMAIDKVRRAIVARLLAALPGDGGAVAAALLVGERGHLPENVIADLRNSGLAHLLAISGLHMGLVAGAMFAAMRGMFALSATLTLTRPIRKWAAVGALVTGFAYLLISGGNVATIRAFVMAAILFGAILVDRPALSLRNLAIAAILVLLMAPESVVEPGFQMSFAAAAALIAVWENWHGRAHDRLAKRAEEIRSGIIGGAGRIF
ncbi:MAG: ComEC/Rec2 family competence protein, partial [Alphaproteobacteria bacterium]